MQATEQPTIATTHECRFCGESVDPRPGETWIIQPTDCEHCGGRWPYLLHAEERRQRRQTMIKLGVVSLSLAATAVAYM